MSKEKWLFEELEKYAKSDVYPFHMPGHKRCMGTEACRLDITEISGFDDLHQAQGLIRDAQERMAKLFGAAESFFLVNGSTAGILAAICACTKKGGRMLMARNCHKSVYHGVLLQELEADYLHVPLTQWGFGGSVSADEVARVLAEDFQRPGRHYEAVFLTSPTYDGIVSDIRAITEVVHAYQIPLIVDEAHGAHFGFSKGFPEKAIALGADLVIESLHKTLPAYTQSAVLHRAESPYVDQKKLRQYLQIFQSSSPSYLLMSGMDRCVRFLQTEGERYFREFEERLARFYEASKAFQSIAVYGGREDSAVWQKDPSKILISAEKAGISGPALFSLLRDRYRLELEMASRQYVTALTSLMDREEGFSRLLAALQEIDAQAAEIQRGGDAKADRNGVREERESDELPEERTAERIEETFVQDRHSEECTAERVEETFVQDRHSEERIAERVEEAFVQDRHSAENLFPERKMTIWKAMEQPSEEISLTASPGRICAAMVTPYPPGIPLLVPGEVITEEMAARIFSDLKAGIKITGLQEDFRIPVITA